MGEAVYYQEHNKGMAEKANFVLSSDVFWKSASCTQLSI